MNVRAKVALKYGGKWYRPGDVLSMSESDAAAAGKNVEVLPPTKPWPVRKPEPEPAAEEPEAEEPAEKPAETLKRKRSRKSAET